MFFPIKPEFAKRTVMNHSSSMDLTVMSEKTWPLFKPFPAFFASEFVFRIRFLHDFKLWRENKTANTCKRAALGISGWIFLNR